MIYIYIYKANSEFVERVKESIWKRGKEVNQSDEKEAKKIKIKAKASAFFLESIIVEHN